MTVQDVMTSKLESPLPPPAFANSWMPLSEDIRYLPCGASVSAVGADGPNPSILIDACESVSSYRVRCVVTSLCGGLNSRVATIDVCTGCVADVDCDCDVDLDDLLIVLGNFGS